MASDAEHDEDRPSPARPEIEPLPADGVRVVEIGTLLWLIAFVALLPFYGRLSDAGRGWWLWTCLAGFGIGAFGVEWCRRRRDAAARP
ncbi:MAG: DUF2530 domain-containing protein [Nocardioides sp.]|uniref:DUF2530 domain-containing protein n=1 Tax=Nocardioides sp. TaxID=35761 RepID=UPI0039E32B61